MVPHERLLRAHFGGVLPSPLELETARLSGDRSAFLACDEPRRRNPFLLVTSASGELLWTKEHPLAGTRQVVTEMAVTPGPHGEVALLWCDIPTQVVGLRRWAEDGVVLADFAVVEVDLCEALSGLYWPGHGWVAVASQHGAARVQLLDESGRRAWGPKGGELPWTARPSSPAAIAVDTDDSVMLFQVGDLRRGEGSVRSGSGAGDALRRAGRGAVGAAARPRGGAAGSGVANRHEDQLQDGLRGGVAGAGGAGREDAGKGDVQGERPRRAVRRGTLPGGR